MSHGGDSLRISGVPVPRANDLLGASYWLYRHVKTNETIVRTLGYALPVALDGHVQVVVPTTSFDSPEKQLQEPNERFIGEKREDDILTRLAVLSWIYSTWAYSAAATDKNSLGIASLWQEASKEDLNRFLGTYRSIRKEVDFTVKVFNPDQDPNEGPVLKYGLMASTQMQYAQGMAYPTPHISYIIGPGPSGRADGFLPWLEYMVNAKIVPQTILIPKGTNEKIYSREHAERVCDEIAKLGARGVSVLVASGDSGVGGGTCKDGSGKVRFLPTFPATCTSFLNSQVVHKLRYGSLITRPRFRRSLGHCRWRNDGLHARVRGKPLRRWLLGLFCAPRLPAGGRVQLPSGRDPRERVSGKVQVRLHP